MLKKVVAVSDELITTGAVVGAVAVGVVMIMSKTTEINQAQIIILAAVASAVVFRSVERVVKRTEELLNQPAELKTDALWQPDWPTETPEYTRHRRWRTGWRRVLVHALIFGIIATTIAGVVAFPESEYRTTGSEASRRLLSVLLGDLLIAFFLGATIGCATGMLKNRVSKQE